MRRLLPDPVDMWRGMIKREIARVALLDVYYFFLTSSPALRIPTAWAWLDRDDA